MAFLVEYPLMFTSIQERLSEAYSEMLASTSEKVVEIFPQLIITIVVLIVGAVVAHIAYKLVLKFSDFIGLDKIAAKVNMDHALKTIGLKSSISRIVGILVYWLIILFALMLLSETLEFGAVSDAIGAIVGYIPRLIIGLLLLVVGLVIGRFLRDVVSTSLARVGMTASAVLGHLVQVVIVLFACLLALKQIGFDVSIITTNIAVIVAVVLASAGLAIALGMRPVLEQMFCSRHIRPLVRKGDKVEIDGVKGEVVEITLTHILIDEGSGIVSVPSKKFCESNFTKRKHS